MARLLRRRKRKRRVLVDVDTQYDLFLESGPQAQELLRQVRRVMAWARVRKVSVISTALCQRAASNGNHQVCVEGTPGQKKVRCTLLGRRRRYEAETRMDLPQGLLSDYQQVIFEKMGLDPFEVPRADRLLTELAADEFVVLGMGAAEGVKATVLGLLHRGKKVRVLVDAVGGRPGDSREMALRQMAAKGARLTTVHGLAGRSRLVGQASLRVRSEEVRG